MYSVLNMSPFIEIHPIHGDGEPRTTPFPIFPFFSFFTFFFFFFVVALRSNHRIVRHKTDIWWTQQGDHSGRWTKTEKNRTNRWAIERF